MTTCAKGFERPLCLHEIPPQLLADTVAAAVADLCSDESPVVIAAVERKEEYTAPIS